MKRSRETVAFLLLLILGLAPRLFIISRFPTIPVSDFHNLVAFGLQLRHDIISRDAPWFWRSFNLGLPLILCGLFKTFPHADPDAVARFATAVVNGLLPLLPFWIWRGVLSFRLRVLAGAALALWPGQVLFSGVVAQDNWVLFPSVALGAVAVRSLADGERAWPVTAGLLYAAGAAVRADMLLMLFPLWLAAVRVDLLRVRWRQVVAGTLAAGCALLGLAAYRHTASGRFALTPEIAGVTSLGAYLPGAIAMGGWVPPYAYISSVRPDLLRDLRAMRSQAAGLAVREALRRPGFHALRIVSMLGFHAMDSDSVDLHSSLEADEVLPPAIHERGAALATLLKQPFRIELSAIQALFLAAVIVGWRRRNPAILVLASAVVLKYGLHAFGVLQGRYLVVATAVEILTIAVAVEEILRPAVPGRGSLLARALAVGAALGLVLFFLSPPLLAYAQRRDIDPQQHTYHFVLEPANRLLEPSRQGVELACVMEHGVLVVLWPPLSATIRTFQQNPAPGDKAVAVCELTGSGKPRPLILEIIDPYAGASLERGRMIQRVELDGAEIFSQDIVQEPRSGWANIPLGNVGAGTKKRVVIEVKAIRPDPDAGSGYNPLTTFQIAWASSVVHLAMAKPAAQSSTLSGYTTTGAKEAVDGNTNGNFFEGSVTHTNLDTNAWWQVDLLASVPLRSIVIWNRTDCCSDRLEDYWVFVSDTPFGPSDTPSTLQHRAGTFSSHQTTAPNPSTTIATSGVKGRYVRVQLTGTNYLSLAEVQVFAQ